MVRTLTQIEIHASFRASLPAILLFAHLHRAGVRFWDSDLEKSQLEHTPIPTWLGDGISSVAGRFAKLLAQSIVQRKAPSLVADRHQAGRLCSCFAAYTHLSTSLSPKRLLPKPLWYSWTIAAMVGRLGSAISSAVEGTGDKTLLGHTLKGTASIGMVIAVQVTTCAEFLDRFE